MRVPYDKWEEIFLGICEDHLEEEPIYPYAHLWKKGLAPMEAFQEFLTENPDYAEKFADIAESQAHEGKDTEQSKKFLNMAKDVAEKRLQKEAEAALSHFCPECAREIGTKSHCKCGFRRASSQHQDDEWDIVSLDDESDY